MNISIVCEFGKCYRIKKIHKYDQIWEKFTKKQAKNWKSSRILKMFLKFGKGSL